MAITAETRQDIIELVVTAYNGAPGTTLLTTLVAIVDDGGSLADVATYLTTSDRWNDLYPSFQTSEEFAEEWLGELVPEASEEALAEGVTVAVGLLNGGASFADLILEAQGFLSATAEDDASFGTSAANFNNKVEVAENHTVTLELDGTEDELANVLANVTSDDDSVEDANEEQSQGADGETFTLTDELDTISGTVNNDTVNGVIGAAADTTFNVADSIDLGAGDNDQVNVNIIGSHDLAGHGAAGAERINITLTDDGAASDTANVTVTAFTDATSIWVQNSTNVDSDNDDSVLVTGVDEDSAVGVANNTSSTDVSFTTDGDDTSGDSITLAVGGGSTDDVTINDAQGDGIATVNIAVSGSSSSTIGSLNAGTDFDEIIITGDQNLSLVGSIDAVPSSVEDIDASAFTGNLTINATASEDLTATGGSGSDTIALTVSDNIEEDMAISGFETVSFYATGAGAEIDMDLITGASVYSINGVSTALTLTLNDVAADSTFFATGLGSATAADTTSAITINLADDDGDSDAVSFIFNNLGVDTGTVDQSVGLITVEGIETLNITADNYDDLDASGIDGDDLVTINYSGDADLDLSASLNADSLEEFDGADATGDIHFTGSIDNVAVDSEITTGSGGDEVTNTALTGTHTQAIDTNAGDDEFTLVDVAAGAELDVELGDGDDTIEGGDSSTVAAASQIVIDAGDGEDTLNVNNAGFTATVGSVEQIVLIATPGGGLNFIDGDAGDVVISDLPDGGLTINAVGGDLDASGVEYLANSAVLTLQGADGVADDITGSAGADTIDGGTGADELSGGAGVDTFLYNSATDTGVATAAASTSTSTLDILSVAAGDLISLAGALTTAANYDALETLQTAGAIDNVVTGTTVNRVQGVYDSSANTFTPGATGANAVLIEYASDDGNTADQGIILTGVTDVTSITNGVLTV